MKQALIVSILTIFMFAACSSNNTPQTQYYLLNSPTGANITNAVNENSKNVVITLLELPEYLIQPSLVLQLSSHQLHYSHFHMWAEPLQSSFTQALALDLNTIASRYHFIMPSTPNEINADTNLVVKITAFHVTHQSQAILTGSYWLQGKNIKRKQIGNDFSISVQLKSDGYPHAVEQMRKAVTQLANEISNKLTVK